VASLEDKLTALATMSLAQLRGHWLQLYRVAAPDVGPQLLIRGLAYRLQEQAVGGLEPGHAKELSKLAGQLARKGAITFTPNTQIRTGTRLVREWQGVSHHVMIREDGYLYKDEVYSSLSQIAQHITGAIWSGPRFFGLRGGRAVSHG